MVLTVILVGAAAHDLGLAGFTIEDAAIDFAYAKHLVDGDGLVPTPGGEWLEGYSNPTWVALLALTTLLRIDPFLASHALGLVLSLATVLVVWRIARRAAPVATGIPLLAPAFLATSLQFAMWGTAGLENPLWNLLFALAIWRGQVEVEEEGFRWPLSALAWLLLSLTRPEGILYAAAGGFFHLAWTLARKRTLVPTALWLLLYFVPWTAYQVWHYATFAWPVANTYYAKLERHELHPWLWRGRGWNWTSEFFRRSAYGFYLPVWLLGVLSARGPRVWLAYGLVVVVGLVTQLGGQRFLPEVLLGACWGGLALVLLRLGGSRRWVMAAATGLLGGLVVSAEILRYLGHPPAIVPVPQLFQWIPPYVLAALAPLVALAGLGSGRDAALRVQAWVFCCLVVLFAVYSEGDWMKGYRWYALATVPGSLLFAFGTYDLSRWLLDVFELPTGDEVRSTVVGWVLSAVLVLALVPVHVSWLVEIAAATDATPWSVSSRIDYVRVLAARAHVDEPLVVTDVDMGAHLLWSDFEMLDLAGLVDVSFAHHHWQKPFVEEYVFREKRPFEIHVHDFWATRTRFPSNPSFRRDYVAVPPFPAGQNLHDGSYVRRDVLFEQRWPHAGPRVALSRGLTLYTPHVPTSAAADGTAYVEVGMQRPPGAAFRVLLFASDGEHLRSWDLPPAYDWVEPDVWRGREVFVGRYALPVGDLPPGTYDLGLVAMDADGTVLAPLPRGTPPTVVAGGTDEVPAVLARGEVRFPGVLRVVSPEERDREATAALERAETAGAAGRCDEAEAAWSDARHLHEGDTAWAEERAAAVHTALARCWAAHSDGTAGADRVRDLLRAHRWDFREPSTVSRSRALAAQLYEEGLAARAAEDHDLAYRRFADAVALDGRLAWARRYAEEARVERLGLRPIEGW
ncbi:MAG: hypothetical protein H6735_25445 [Alphaproteobacteria bacterium]|nr:hypothetical protein [Alphaproteobacteria bacterium]